MNPAFQTPGGVRLARLFVSAFLWALSSCTSSASTNPDIGNTEESAIATDLGITEADRGVAREDAYDGGSASLVDTSTFDAFPERQVFDAVSEGEAASDTSLVADGATESTAPLDASLGLACGANSLRASFVNLDGRVQDTGCLSFRDGLRIHRGIVGATCGITALVGDAISPPETPMLERLTVEVHFNPDGLTSTGRVPVWVFLQFFKPGTCNLPNGSCVYATPHGRLVPPSCFVEVLQAGSALGDPVAARLLGDCTLQDNVYGRLPPIQLRGLEFQTRLVEGPAFGNPDAGVLCDW